LQYYSHCWQLTAIDFRFAVASEAVTDG
jgi:hypothetical protein